MQLGKARTGHSAALTCHQRRPHTPPRSRCVVWTRGGSRMRESRTYGSVRGALSYERPYRDRSVRTVRSFERVRMARNRLAFAHPTALGPAGARTRGKRPIQSRRNPLWVSASGRNNGHLPSPFAPVFTGKVAQARRATVVACLIRNLGSTQALGPHS